MSDPAQHKPILILGAAPRISIPIARSLSAAGIPVEVASFLEADPVLGSKAIRRTHRLPAKDPELVDALVNLIQDENFDMLIPTSDPSLALAARHYDRLRSLLHPGCPPAHIVDRVLNKAATLAAAEGLGIKVPFSFAISNIDDLEALSGRLRFPVVVKPAERGVLTFKVAYCQNAPQLVGFVSANQCGPLLVQEYCPGVGVGIEILMHQGKAIATFQHRRLKEAPSSGGVAVMAIAEEVEPALAQASFDLLRAIEWEGPAMVEYRYDRPSGQAALMEINGRFWGTTSLPILAGLDFPLYHWQVVHGVIPQVPESYRVGTRWRWTAGYIDRTHGVMAHPSAKIGSGPSRWRVLADVPGDFSPAIRDALWSWSDPWPALMELAATVKGWAVADLKWLARKLLPRTFLQWRSVYHRLGVRAGRMFLQLKVRDALGMRRKNQTRVRPGAKNFVFICFGNLMRSPMAEAMFTRATADRGVAAKLKIWSAGLHAQPGREAHPWAQAVSSELGYNLGKHRAQLLTPEMVEEADAIFAMDFQNKAELLALYPQAQHKLIMLSAYAEGAQRFREIADPYFGDENEVRRCYKILQTCVRNLVRSLWPASEPAVAQGVGAIR
jgi:protein-tyrosine-phosphatase/predicted ATP-grasp superfamily ATP-dependent carboligase